MSRYGATMIKLLEKGLNPVEGSNDYRTQRYKDADAIYAFQSLVWRLGQTVKHQGCVMCA